MESEKFEFSANYVFADFSQITGVVCEDSLTLAVKNALKEYEVKVIE